MDCCIKSQVGICSLPHWPRTTLVGNQNRIFLLLILYVVRYRYCRYSVLNTIIKGTVSRDEFGVWGHAWPVLGLKRGRGQFLNFVGAQRILERKSVFLAVNASLRWLNNVSGVTWQICERRARAPCFTSSKLSAMAWKKQKINRLLSRISAGWCWLTISIMKFILFLY